jgi:hypothetical protein
MTYLVQSVASCDSPPVSSLQWTHLVTGSSSELGELISFDQKLGSDLIGTSSSFLMQRFSLSCTLSRYSSTSVRSDPNLPTFALDRWRTPGSICHPVPLHLSLAEFRTLSFGSQSWHRSSSVSSRYPSPFECHPLMRQSIGPSS